MFNKVDNFFIFHFLFSKFENFLLKEIKYK